MVNDIIFSDTSLWTSDSKPVVMYGVNIMLQGDIQTETTLSFAKLTHFAIFAIATMFMQR